MIDKNAVYNPSITKTHHKWIDTIGMHILIVLKENINVTDMCEFWTRIRSWEQDAHHRYPQLRFVLSINPANNNCKTLSAKHQVSLTGTYVLSVWGERFFLLSFAMPYLACWQKVWLRALYWSLTHNIDKVMGVWIFRRRTQNTKFGKNGLLKFSFWIYSQPPKEHVW